MQSQKTSKRDSKNKSLIESAFDIGTGCLMYVPINYFILPLFLDTIENHEIFGLLQISAIFTGKRRVNINQINPIDALP